MRAARFVHTDRPHVLLLRPTEVTGAEIEDIAANVAESSTQAGT
jgi:hypothetical protein